MPAHSDLAAWLRLTLAPGLGGEGQRKLLETFGLPRDVFAASPLRLAECLGPKLTDTLLNHDSDAEVEAALVWAGQPGNRILTLADADYPRQLLETADPPCLLYVKGRIDLLSRPALAVVGSRNATPQGVDNAESIARAASQAGLTIVSGLALGCDAAAHRGGLSGPGSTVAVIGTGADRIYPARNQALAHSIVDHGAIVSEFPLGTPPLAGNFPRRNRVIAGLARGVLVVEAADRSGTLITARLAGEQGRDVFAIPGSIHSPLSKGCHKLIKQGAKLVESAQDILEEMGLEADAVATSAAADRLDDSSSQVLAALGYDPCSIDTLLDRSGLTADALYPILLSMELEGRIATLPGGLYQRIERDR